MFLASGRWQQYPRWWSISSSKSTSHAHTEEPSRRPGPGRRQRGQGRYAFRKQGQPYHTTTAAAAAAAIPLLHRILLPWQQRQYHQQPGQEADTSICPRHVVLHPVVLFVFLICSSNGTKASPCRCRCHAAATPPPSLLFCPRAALSLRLCRSSNSRSSSSSSSHYRRQQHSASEEPAAQLVNLLLRPPTLGAAAEFYRCPWVVLVGVWFKSGRARMVHHELGER